MSRPAPVPTSGSTPSLSASSSSSSSSSYPPPSAFLRVKAGNFSRLLYTNPVCLLTSQAQTDGRTNNNNETQTSTQTNTEKGEETTPTATATTTPAASDSSPIPSTVDATAECTADAASVEADTPTPTGAIDSAPNIAVPESTPSSSSSSADVAAGVSASGVTPSTASAPPATPVRNVMTISWLTATSNHGEVMLSMNAGRYTAGFVCRPGDKFVLNVPVKGMEELVKRIGGCSGREFGHTNQNADGMPTLEHAVDKFAALGIPTCRPGNKPIGTAPPSAATTKKPHTAAAIAESEADAEDDAFSLIAIPTCAAHLVLTVESVHLASSPAPLVRAHNILFCRVTRAYVHSDYWENGNNFIATKPSVPPYLTFLGSGNFAYVTK